MVSTLLILILFICLAGVVYPFPPFKTRKRAIISMGLVFAFSFVSFSIENNNPAALQKRTGLADAAILQAEEAIERGDIEKAKTVLQELDYRAAEQEADKVAKVQAKITRLETLPVLKTIALDKDITPSDKIWQLRKLWKSLGRSNAVKEALSSDFETHMLSIVKPVPAENYKLNKEGYEFLVEITQYSNDPNPTYSKRASEYAGKVKKAENFDKGCSEPNYAFTSKVPPLLKDPSSFKAIRVYFGPKDGNGNQTAFMDYYAANGFGGRIKQTATGNVDLVTCDFTLVSPLKPLK